jgi:DNA polymerase-3 subunit epsilon
MHLERPLIAFDLETTGLDIKNDRIVEIALIKLRPDETRLEACFTINPCMPIPPSATQVHGITDEDVCESPTFAYFAEELESLFDGCDLTGYNIAAFDVPFLAAEFARVGRRWPAPGTKIVDSWRIAVKQIKRDLQWALRYYCDEFLLDAHTALADTRAALSVVLAQSHEYAASDIDALDALQRDPDWIDADGRFKRTKGGVVITFGKHAGQTVDRVPTGYLQWMLNADFSSEIKDIIQAELDRRRAA